MFRRHSRSSAAAGVAKAIAPASRDGLTAHEMFDVVEDVRDDVMRVRGVVGLGVGRGDTANSAVLEVYLTDAQAKTQVPTRLRPRLSGLPVRYVVTGRVRTT